MNPCRVTWDESHTEYVFFSCPKNAHLKRYKNNGVAGPWELVGWEDTCFTPAFVRELRKAVREERWGERFYRDGGGWATLEPIL